MSRMMSVALIATLMLAGVAHAQSQAKKQPSQSASASSPKPAAKKSAVRARSIPSRPAGISAAEQNAFDRAAQSNH